MSIPAALPTPERLGELWRFPGDYGPLSQQQGLLAAGDRLLGVAGGTLFALDVFRGREPVPDERAAERGFPYSFRTGGSDPFLTAAGGVVYFMDGEELTALRLSDGLPLQTRDAAGRWQDWEPPVLEQVSGLFAVDDRVVAVHLGASGDTEVTALRAVDGERLFGPVVISDLSPGRVSYGDGAVFFVADGRLHAVNTDFGDARFARTGGGTAAEALSPAVAPCVGADVVLAAGGSLHFFDVRTGAERFTPIAPSRPRAAWRSPVLAQKGALMVASNAGEVVAVRTSDGSVAWRTELTDPGEPTVLRGQVLVTTERRGMLAMLSVATGAVERRMLLPQAASGLAPVVTNETVFIPDARGGIEARPFGRQHAAYFDGRAARIDVAPDEAQFDFGVDDFTIEAWIRSSEGGEIVSSHPTLAGQGHGFRLNLGENGELRVALVDPVAHTLHAGRTRPTRANDGEWHHVALIRREGALLALLDGRSLDVFFRDDSRAGLAIGGRSALTIGAYRAGPAAPALHHFQGLIRELRIWDRALDVATVQNNRGAQLTGTEPRLKGLWPLAEVQHAGKRTDPRNAVARHGARATFAGAWSVPTDLALDRSAFPYLLHEAAAQWPYAGTWAARGEQPVSSRAAGAANAVAFATGNALYGVRRADGRRLWQADLPAGSSAPVGDGARFLALTGDDGVIAIHPATGAWSRVDAFAGLLKEGGGPLAAPAVSATHLAAGAPHGTVRLVERRGDPARVRDVALPGPVRELTLDAHRLVACCGPDGDLRLAVVDLAGTATSRVSVSSPAFAADGDWLYCVRGGRLARVAAAALSAAAVQADVPDGAVTAMAARPDDDLLVVTTDAGTVHGFAMGDLSRRWSAALPAGRAGGSNAVHAPAFDDAGRVYCTTASGTVAVLDPDTGDRVGLYLAAEAITTPPFVAAATAYYGCDDPQRPDAFADGALHSVVFGETVVLRLGLDERGAPSHATTYARVEVEKVDVDLHALHLLDPSRSCVEAWVNLPAVPPGSARRPGGGVLGICPTAAGGSGVNLAVDEDGTVRYSASVLRRGRWRTLRVEAACAVEAGEWHHVAVSRDGDDHAIVYVDGRALDGVLVTSEESRKPAAVPGIRAYLGAEAGEALEAVRPFCGMIAEVRVWDTCLQPAELAGRMHAKLRGNEPDLLAYWDFDRQNVEDAGPEHHHGALEGVGGDPVWWLADAAFEKPSYPFVTTAARILQQPAGEPPTYQLSVTVHRADGTGIAGHPLDLWYVRRRDDDPEETRFDLEPLAGVVAAAQPEPGTPSPDGRRRVVSATTGSEGTATFLVTPTRVGHAPAIDLRAGFMARNGRFHVNVLLDRQAMGSPTPPSLVVQSKLVQDYAYSSGGKIDESRDRSTWRTVIRATNADGSLRVDEPLSLWAQEQLTVQVAGRSYAINRENAAELVTDGQGEVVVVCDAGALTATGLMARAGFMHRNDRVVIAPDQDLHRQLGATRGSELVQKRKTRWKPGMKEGDGETLLPGEYAPHADKVAEAIVTVMAAAGPAEAEPDAAPRGTAPMLRARARARTGLLRAAHPVADAEPMRQPVREAGADRVVTLRTTLRASPAAPVNPAGVRAALARSAGFVFEAVADPAGRPGVRFELLETRAQVDEERGEATPHPVLLRAFWDDVWDTVKDVAEDVYEGAVKVVVSIADAVEVAIHKMVDGILSVVHVVVGSIVEAVRAVASFFEQLGVLIMKVIEFLRALFDWKAILAAKNIISAVLLHSIESAVAAMRPDRIDAAFLPLIGGIPAKLAPGGKSVTATTADAGEPRSPALDEARGVQGQMVMQKSREGGMTASASAGVGPDGSAGDNPVSSLILRLPSLLTGALDLSPADLVDRMLSLLQEGVEQGVRAFIAGLKEMSALMVPLVEWAVKALRTEIQIPFLSDLYRWITGSELTLLDLFCLGVAVPVHVAHLVATGRSFADDNHDLPARLRAHAGGTLSLRAPARGPVLLAAEGKVVPRPMDTTVEPYLITCRVLNIACGLVSDALFTKNVGSAGLASEGEVRARAFAKVVKGVTGIATSTLMRYSQKAFEARLESGLPAAAYNQLKSDDRVTEAVFVLQVAGDLITFGGGVKSLLSPPGLPFGPGTVDKWEFRLAVMAMTGMGAAIGGRVGQMVVAVDTLNKANAHDSLIQQVRFFAYRDITNLVGRLPWCLFTETGANMMGNKYGAGGARNVYALVTTLRAAAQTASLTTHVLAVYG